MRKILILFILLSTIFTVYYVVPSTLSYSKDDRMARAFVTDEADLCEIIERTVNTNEGFKFSDYGFIYYKSGIWGLKIIKKFHPVNEQIILVFFRLYSYLFFLATAFLIMFILYKHAGLLTSMFSLLFIFLSSPTLFLYSSMLHPDVAQVFFITLSLFFLYRYIANNQYINLWFAAIAAGFAFSCKYSGLLVLPLMYIAIIVLINQSDYHSKKFYIKTIITILLSAITFYFFDANAILQNVKIDNPKSEILTYVKIVKYTGLIIILFSLFAIVTRWIKTEVYERFKLYVISDFLFLSLSSSWLFLSAYLITIPNLVRNYKFLTGLFYVTNLHSSGLHFSTENVFVNWIKLLLENNTFGLISALMFIFSFVITIANFKNLKLKTKLLFVVFSSWQIVFFLVVFIKVKSFYAHYLLPAIPTLIVIISIGFALVLTIKQRFYRYLFISFFVIILFERAFVFASFYKEKQIEELNSNSIKAGNWLSENIDTLSRISANNYCYIPKGFKGVDFNWGTNYEDIYNPNIDYIILHSKITDRFADTSMADRYRGGKERFLYRNKLRNILLNNQADNYKLLKDFNEVKIFKRISAVKSDTVFYSFCNFKDSLNIEKYWKIDYQYTDSCLLPTTNKHWHFTNKLEWGPTFDLNLYDLSVKEDLLLEVKLNIIAHKKIPEAIIIIQIDENDTLNLWQKTDMLTQLQKTDTIQNVYANCIIQKKYFRSNKFRLWVYVWNISKDDFCVDDFEIVLRKMI